MSLDWIGDTHLRVRWNGGASQALGARIRSAYRQVRAAGLRGLIDLTPASSSLLLRFDISTLEPDRASTLVRNTLANFQTDPKIEIGQTVEVPVCYEGEHAPDLADVAARCSLRPSDVVGIHSGAEYLVRFIGFAPGFPYLDGLSPRLNVPRLDTPRPRVPAGSVAIAGDQACVYPHATPGGWRIVGRTPFRLFDASSSPPSLLAMGDRVRFVPIPAVRFRALATGGD
jgi:KipI family sensor histidine kinase inhibitor